MVRSAKNRNSLAPSIESFPPGRLFPVLILFASRTREEIAHGYTEMYKRRPFCSRLHHDTTFKLVVAHPRIVRSPITSSYPSTHIYDVVIFRWRIRHRYVILLRIHYRVAEQYAHECITPTHNSPGSTGIYAIVIYDIANYFRKRVRKRAVVALNF